MLLLLLLRPLTARAEHESAIVRGRGGSAPNAACCQTRRLRVFCFCVCRS